jgi:hypothetical protein
MVRAAVEEGVLLVRAAMALLTRLRVLSWHALAEDQ